MDDLSDILVAEMTFASFSLTEAAEGMGFSVFQWLRYQYRPP